MAQSSAELGRSEHGYIYTGHSCRAAATSAALFKGVGVKTILKSASWSNVNTFRKFYLKQLEDVYDKKENFGAQLLSAHDM